MSDYFTIPELVVKMLDEIHKCVELEQPPDNRDECFLVIEKLRTLKNSLQSLLDLSYYPQPLLAILPDVAITLSTTLKKMKRCRRPSLDRLFYCPCKGVCIDLQKSIEEVDWVAYMLRSAMQKEGKTEKGKCPELTKLPPVTIKETIAKCWFHIALLYWNSKVDAACHIIDLVGSKDIILQEGGLVPLLEMVKSGFSDSQKIGLRTLITLADSYNRARTIACQDGVNVIRNVLGGSCGRILKTSVAQLVKSIAEFCHESKELFAEQGVTLQLLRLMSNVSPTPSQPNPHRRPRRIKKVRSSCSILDSSTSMDRCRFNMRVAAVEALHVLTTDSPANCTIVASTNGLLKLAQGVSEETIQFRLACLSVLLNISIYSEENSEFRNDVFGPKNNDAAHKIVTEVVALIDESASVVSEILSNSIKVVANLGHIFGGKSTKRVVEKLVTHLKDSDPDVRSEAVKALLKFTCEDNNLKEEYVKRILDCKPMMAITSVLDAARQETTINAITLLCSLREHGHAPYLKFPDQVLMKKILSGINLDEYPQLRVLVERTLALLPVQI